MKAPDKCYITREKNGVIYSLSFNDNGGLEYIRKDALMEWLEKNRKQAQMWFDRYNDREDLSAKQVWEEVIDKLNSL